MNIDSPSHAVSDEAVLRIVREVLTELHPGRKDMGLVTLDSALEEDLGLDSLARVELLMRLERAFGVRPPEHMLSTAEAPRDLLRALLSARRMPSTVCSNSNRCCCSLARKASLASRRWASIWAVISMTG